MTYTHTEIVNSNCWWVGTGNVWFAGYQGLVPPIYTSSVTPLNCSANYGAGVGIGTFAKGHEYLISYGTWSNACPWAATSQTAYFCSNCRTEDFQTKAIPYSLSFEEATGIKQAPLLNAVSSNKMNIYPNPNNGHFTVEGIDTDMNSTVEIYDVNGKLLLSQKTNNNSDINASDLPQGVYNVCVRTDASIAYKKLIIVK